MKTAAIVALVAISATDAKSVNGTINGNKIYGETTSNGTLTQGAYVYNGTIDGKMTYIKKEYVINGTKTKEERKKLSKEDRRKEMKDAKTGVSTVVKFDKYFYYAMDLKNVKEGSTTKQCDTTQDCGQDNGPTKCCVNALITGKKEGKQSSVYRCMNKAIADINMDITINDMSVKMRCLGSGAGYIKPMFMASAATLAAMTLY